jgi:hypothetical protein
MPLVEVLHTGLSDEKQLRIKRLLKDSVATELDCSDTDPDSALVPGDINVRFRAYGPNDDAEFDIDVLVIAKWFDSRAKNVDERTGNIRSHLCRNLGYDINVVGVFVTLPVSGWAQGYPGD